MPEGQRLELGNQECDDFEKQGLDQVWWYRVSRSRDWAVTLICTWHANAPRTVVVDHVDRITNVSHEVLLPTRALETPVTASRCGFSNGARCVVNVSRDASREFLPTATRISRKFNCAVGLDTPAGPTPPRAAMTHEPDDPLWLHFISCPRSLYAARVRDSPGCTVVHMLFHLSISDHTRCFLRCI